MARQCELLECRSRGWTTQHSQLAVFAALWALEHPGVLCLQACYSHTPLSGLSQQTISINTNVKGVAQLTVRF